MICKPLLGLIVIFLVLELTMTSRIVPKAQCLKAFPAGTAVPDDALMKALYYADPDPDTGYIEYNHQISKEHLSKSIKLKNVVVDYKTWLAKTHNATEVFANFWLYINYLIVSGVRELYEHYRVSHFAGHGVPLGTIDFIHLQDLFSTVCSNFESVMDTWPYNCVEKDVFCSFKSTFAKLMYMVSRDLTFSHKNDYQHILSVSELVADDHLRSEAMGFLFTPEVLKYIPVAVQNSLIYRSKLVSRALLFLSGDLFVSQWSAVDKLLRSYIETRCEDYGAHPLGMKYFCKVKDFMMKMKYCAGLSDYSPCIFDGQVQAFFTHGTLGRFEDLIVINLVTQKTREFITEFKKMVVTNNRPGLSELYKKFHPFVKVDDSMCTLDWPSGFDCTKRNYCKYEDEKFFYDCEGGYNCRLDMMYRFDCLMKFVMGKAKIVLDATARQGWQTESAKKAKYDMLVWIAYVPLARYSGFLGKEKEDLIISTQSQINNLLSKYDYKAMEAFLATLPTLNTLPQWAIDAACESSVLAPDHTVFCDIEPLLDSAILLVNAIHYGQESTSKVLHPNVDYPRLLEQLQLERISDTINSQTEQAMMYITSEIITSGNQVKKAVANNAGKLSNYFASVADYDKTKADADVAYIDGRLTLFKNKITEVSTIVTSLFQTVFKFSVGINIAELAQRSVEVGVAIAQVANPFSTLFGGSSVLDLMGSINELAQAGVTTAIIAQLKDQAFPDLIRMAKNLGTGFLANEEQLKNAKNLIDKLKTGSDATASARIFLGKYNDYDPKVLSSDIAAYGEKWQTVAGQLCDAAFDAGTGASALGEIGLASTGDCTKISSKIEELINLYEEHYDYQFDLMDALSDAARSYLAYQKANDMKIAYTALHTVNDKFLNKFAVNTLLVSLLNIWLIVSEYCNILSYTRGGKVPDQCGRAIRNPNPRTVAQVISYKPSSLCHINNEITKYMTIPVRPVNNKHKAYIDLERLYDRDTVTFHIPNFKWLKDNGWVGHQDKERAVYIKRFEIFLPPMSGSREHTVEVKVDPSMSNYLRQGGTKYLLPVSGYSSRYTENSINCFKPTINNPYALCDPKDIVKLCVTSNGYVDREIQPSVYNEWKVTATSLPPNQIPPNPITDFKLQAAITMCMVDYPTKRRKRFIGYANELTRNKRASPHCCGTNKYWAGTVCMNCPSGSVSKLKGYYCE